MVGVGRRLMTYFRFFAAKCWREIGERQEMARRLIEDGQV